MAYIAQGTLSHVGHCCPFELHRVSFGVFLQSVCILLSGDPALKYVDCSPQLDIICKSNAVNVYSKVSTEALIMIITMGGGGKGGHRTALALNMRKPSVKS